MSGLEFLHADPASPAWRSPLRRPLERAPEGIRDVTALVDETQVAGLCPAAGAAGLEIEGPQARRLLRGLTDLDPDGVPAIGAVAHVRMLVVAEADDRIRLWFPQEYSTYVAEAVLDAGRGIGWA